ncbi:MAG: AAA family ATPase [Lachnospiraceae bacterium]|nr:AAA family ATPase [Lachnospiraceae bacterium]
MNDITAAINKNLQELSERIFNLRKNIVLIFAFNGTGKTRLSVEYKNFTKQRNGDTHAGVYYNAYSEDLFVWDNDVENTGDGMKLNMIPSSLNQYHSSIDENNVREKLSVYKPKFDFKFKLFDDSSKGIESITFYSRPGNEIEDENPIKISRGEERIFVWCFFLALFDVQGWTGQKNSHFFIDDPVSSLDEHNIFVIASTVLDLIDQHYEQRKIIITTHHVGFFSILADWLGKGEKADGYKKKIQYYILKNDNASLQLLNRNQDVFMYHLELLQVLQDAINENKLYAYHFALLRQVLENISSFLGVGRISYVFEQIGIDDTDTVARIVNILSHKTVFRYEMKELVPDNVELFIDIFDKIQKKYNFVIHGGARNE